MTNCSQTCKYFKATVPIFIILIVYLINNKIIWRGRTCNSKVKIQQTQWQDMIFQQHGHNFVPSSKTGGKKEVTDPVARHLAPFGHSECIRSKRELPAVTAVEQDSGLVLLNHTCTKRGVFVQSA